MDYEKMLEEQREYVIELRREFHMYPETGWKEFRTSKRIKEELDKMGVEWMEAAGTGVVATVRGSKNGKTVALRADIDALEVVEENNEPYSSRNRGIMHACGHDGHAAMLLGAARALCQVKEKLHGDVKLVFQPAEELVQGAKKIMEEDVLEDVDGMMGIHLWNDIPVGCINVEPGHRMASADYFVIDFESEEGQFSKADSHANPLYAAAAFTVSSQAIISREKNPMDTVVLTIGEFKSGTSFDSIPQCARVEGTLRCYGNESRQTAIEGIWRYSKEQAAAYGVSVNAKIYEGSPAVVNETSCSLIARKSAERVVGKKSLVRMSKNTGSEDMSYYLEKIPGLMAFVGSGAIEGDSYPHHHPKFNIDERSLFIGCSLYFNFALDFLNN